MQKDILVKKDGTTLRLGNLKAPLQKKAMDLDRSLNWLICKMLREHPDMTHLNDKINSKK